MSLASSIAEEDESFQFGSSRPTTVDGGIEEEQYEAHSRSSLNEFDHFKQSLVDAGLSTMTGESFIPMPTLTIDEEQTTTAEATNPSNRRLPHKIQIPTATSAATHPPMPATAAQQPTIDSDASNNRPPSPPPSSMFNLLGVLNNYRMRIRCRTLDNLFDKINLDARSWNLLVRSQLPRNEFLQGMEQLLDTVTEFVRRSVNAWTS